MKKLYATIIGGTMALFGMAQSISLEHVSTYSTGVFDEGAAEIVTYDKASKRLFFSNADANSIGILDFTDPVNLSLISSIDLSSYGDGVNSVSAYNGVIAVAVQGEEAMDRGHIVFFDSAGTFLSQVEAGYLPDMVTFSHDGMMVIAANEGEPNDEWTEDPEGSVTIIDVSGGVANVSQSNVTELVIGDYTGSWDDVRIYPEALTVFEDGFQEEDTINFDSVFVHWEQFNIQGSSRNWHEYEYPSGSGLIFARISGFDGGCQDNEDYLVTESFDLSGYDDAILNFSSAYNFSGPGLELLISTDFDGTDLFGATWDTITDLATWPASGGYVWTQSGDVDLSAYLDEEVSLAFQYTSNSGGCATWEFDSVMIQGMHSEADNLEPEYVAISEDNSTAFVVMQENNAVAVIDLNAKSITDVQPLGTKDHSVAGNGLDASDKDDEINITTYPFKGMYLPDAITSITIDGTTYYLTANEGDSRDYDGYSEEERLEDLDLDPTAFPDAATLQDETNGGRIKVTTSMGDTDGDGDYDEIYTYGARSFTIWSTTGSVVFDSGDDFEQQLAVLEPDNFNSANDENDSFESRSDDKGPEPEAIEVATINGEHYAFIGLERMGGIMMYNITDPTSPTFVQYINNRDFSVEDVETEAVGDLGCEDVLFIDGQFTADSNFYLVTSNEVSGTVSVFQIVGAVGIDKIKEVSSFSVFPNPSSGVLNFSVKGDYTIMDMSGRQLKTVTNKNTLDVTDLSGGVYIVTDQNGAAMTFVKQ